MVNGINTKWQMVFSESVIILDRILSGLAAF